MFESSVAMTMSQHPQQGRVARKAIAGVDTDKRHRPRQLGKPEKCQAVEATHPELVGVAGPAATTFGEKHDRQAELLGQLEQPILLAVVLRALGSGKHGVVVRHRNALACAFVSKQIPVDVSDTGNKSVARCVLDQIGQVTSPTLRGDDERPVLDQAPLIDEVSNVLPRCAPPSPSALRHSVRSRRVEPTLMALDDFGQIGPVETGRQRQRRGNIRWRQRCVVTGVHRVAERHQDITDCERRAFDDRNRRDHPISGGNHLVVHLHRLNKRQSPAKPHRLARARQQRDHGSLQLRHHVNRHRQCLQHSPPLPRSGESVGRLPESTGYEGERWNVVID